MYHYKITPMQHGSDRFGPCEVCGEYCPTTFYQVETKDYRHTSIHGETRSGRTHHECISRWGHKECLIASRRQI